MTSPQKLDSFQAEEFASSLPIHLPAMPTTARTFRAKLGTEQAGSLFFEVPFDVKAVFGKSRPPIKVTINGYTYRSTPAIYAGRTYVPVRASNRDAAGVSVGDTVTVTLDLDTAVRDVRPPPPLARALKRDARARAAWEALSYSHKKEHSDAISSAKKPETRDARLERALTMLRNA